MIIFSRTISDNLQPNLPHNYLKPNFIYFSIRNNVSSIVLSLYSWIKTETLSDLALNLLTQLFGALILKGLVFYKQNFYIISNVRLFLAIRNIMQWYHTMYSNFSFRSDNSIYKQKKNQMSIRPINEFAHENNILYVDGCVVA